MDGVQSSWLVLVVDYGIITLCHSLVTMSTDILGAKDVDNDRNAGKCIRVSVPFPFVL